ncbi:chemotaxis protein CheB [Psychrobacter aestuarii]|uniref:protein-glutamate methylesterase n=1 Tax=Psychrobacter aestuarii TaxID=556327 RepID=A0ABN0VTR5_9GAMM|nr:chemotaxis protein CheB [Psychrobacter aestuarii]
MTDDTQTKPLADTSTSDITMLVVAESQHQRLALSETIRGCGFTLIDSVNRAQLKRKPIRNKIDVWLIDGDYDDDTASMIANTQSKAVLVGFSQAPYFNAIQYYAKWQRKLKRKLAQILEMPVLAASPVYEHTQPHWQYVVLLGASMGGPSAVKEFLDNLSPDLPICILLAHHFNPSMVETLPRVINRHNDWRCQLITSTRRLQAGHCLIAPINQQIVCDSTGRVIVTDKTWPGGYKPAIGEILKNASDVYGSRLISIIFSGMGTDGSQHLATIQDNHSQLWVQDPRLSTCPSQPQSVLDSGYCQFSGSPTALAQKLTDYIAEMTQISYSLS